jgi:hypothetical protein
MIQYRVVKYFYIVCLFKISSVAIEVRLSLPLLAGEGIIPTAVTLPSALADFF